MLSREDRILSEILVSRGLVARERVEACASRLRRSRSGGSLAESLLASGDLAPGQVDQAVEEARSLDEALAPELPVGKKLGEFRLLREIGRGGMGIVYEAVQESLGRHVALKVLPAGAALDERLAIRFLREARAAARLRHPGIVPVFTSGRDEGILYFAMELIDGHSLAEAIARGALDPAQAARLAAEVARALGHAHAAGLVHRDVKPENILVTREGRARVADFGLVLEIDSASRTLTRHVLGTPAFIAPEQARGQGVDARSDIYGLGAVLYAMLTGGPPYAGEVPSLVLARVLTERPRALLALRPDLPTALAAICERAMAADPAARYASAEALAEALERFLAGEPAAATAPSSGRRRPGRSIALPAAGILLALAAFALLRGQRIDDAPAVAAPHIELDQLPPVAGRKASPAVSADGRWLAYASDLDGNWDIFLQDLAGGEPRNVSADSPLDDLSPAFSPDGRALAFSTPTVAIRVVDLASMQRHDVPVPIAAGLSWTSDSREILFTDRMADGPGQRATASKLFAVEVRSGHVRTLTGSDGSQPDCSPKSGRVAFVSGGGGHADIWTTPHGGGNALRLTDDDAQDWSPVWPPGGGRILFGSDREGGAGALFEIAVDEATGRPTGPPTRVSGAILPAPFYLAATRTGDQVLMLIGKDHAGRLHRVHLGGESAARIEGLPDRFVASAEPDLSADGSWLTFTAMTSHEDLAVSAADGSAARLLTTDAFADRAPRWSPDGTEIAFHSDRGGHFEIWTVRPDGRDLRRRTTTAGDAVRPVWSPDGRQLAFTVIGRGGFFVPVDSAPGETEAEPIGPLDDGTPFEPSSWSRDGRWLAGSAAGVVVYSPLTRRHRRLTRFGSDPVWLDDQRLLFTTERELHLVELRSGASRVLRSFAPSRLVASVSASADGRQVYCSLAASSAEVWRARVKG